MSWVNLSPIFTVRLSLECTKSRPHFDSHVFALTNCCLQGEPIDCSCKSNMSKANRMHILLTWTSSHRTIVWHLCKTINISLVFQQLFNLPGLAATRMQLCTINHHMNLTHHNFGPCFEQRIIVKMNSRKWRPRWFKRPWHNPYTLAQARVFPSLALIHSVGIIYQRSIALELKGTCAHPRMLRCKQTLPRQSYIASELWRA